MFAALTPEINSARMYTGPGPGSMLGAALPNLVWLNATADHATHASGQAG